MGSLSNCGKDENKSYSGGQAGDQTGEEYRLMSWYNRPWSAVYRHSNSTVRSVISQLAADAARNDNIGYDQSNNQSFWKELQKVGYQPSKIKTPCEADCSSSTSAIIMAAGYLCGNKTLANMGSQTASSLLNNLGSYGFTKYTSLDYLKSPAKLMAGDILVMNHHAAIWTSAEVGSTNSTSRNTVTAPKITKVTSTTNTVQKKNRSIEYIVIHYTASVSSKSGSAANIARNTFAGGARKASADFIVDDVNFVQYNPDIENRYCYHCGGSLVSSKAGATYHNKCTNSNSIGIEVCSSNKTGMQEANASGWYYTDAVVNNAITLTLYLMSVYNIPASNVIRHYDVTGKKCPGIIGWNEDTGDRSKWDSFKSKISSGMYSISAGSYLLGDTGVYIEGTSEDVVPEFLGDPGGTTVGQRISGLSDQPLFAYINVWVGEKLLSTSPAKPNLIKSLEVDYLDNAGSQILLTIFDDNWEEIEYNLSAHSEDIYLEYGYYGTGVRSDRLKCRLLKYSIDFNPTGSILSIEAVSEELVDNLTPMTESLNTYNPTEAVKTICKNLGYTVLDENFDESTDIVADNPFNMIEEYPLTYIMRTIIPQASQIGEETFKFYVEYDETTKTNVAYFKRTSLRLTNTDNLRTYIYQKGYDSTVIDFSVDINGVFTGSTGSNFFETSHNFSSSLFSTTEKTETSASATAEEALTEVVGGTSHLLSNSSSVLKDSAGNTPAQAASKLYYRVKTSIYDGYKAKMTIVGDPTVKLWGQGNKPFIRIINVTDAGMLHHTSGIYQISKIHHSIDGGAMITSLELVRASTRGDIEGLEILNPKYVIK